MNKLKTFIALALFSILLSGCGASNEEKASGDEKQENKQEENGKKENAEKKDDPTKVAGSIEEIAAEKPGEYPGTKYNKAIVHRELDDTAFADKDSFEVYQALLKLIREGSNYKAEYDFMESFDPSIQTALTEMPGGIKIDDSGEVGVEANIAVLLDASGSMAQKVNGKTKMELAKQAVDEFVATMPEGANVMLRVYGHEGSNEDADKEVSCKSSEVVYDLAPYDSGSFKDSLGKFQPTGWTPIAKAIADTKKDFEAAGTDGQNIIYVVSDGIETCDGDPVKAAKDLHDSNIDAMVNIIGFNVDNKGQKQLRDVAEAGGGEFKTVNSAEDFNKIWEAERSRLWNEWWNWGNKNWSAVWTEQNKKTSELIEQRNAFSRKASDEHNRLTEAANYLVNKEQINYDTYSEVNSLSQQRQDIIKEYYDQKYEELKETVTEEGENLKTKIRDKEEEMKEKYSKD
ncbi:VWA domain-containing protein [Bacillus massiliglaciei]|uniref:VWA domain-containing protein n=1 Tax=Bacillus massiliglaciei TaxID=1816693 RepID=UPI000DA62B7D|nr:VWA domain-containing protein [Bacillus massiliglaciei]